MRKLFAILLSAILVLAISACGNETGGSTVSNTDTQGAGSETAGASAATPTSPEALTTPDIPVSTGTSTTPSTPVTVTKDEAIEKALKEAGLSRQDVRELEAELDRERGELYWEVDFESGNWEYSYDIHAETGEIVQVERETD